MKYWFKSRDRFKRVWSMVHHHDEPTTVPPMKLYRENGKLLREIDRQSRDKYAAKYTWLPVHNWLDDPNKPTDFATYEDALKEYLLCEYFECYYTDDEQLLKKHMDSVRKQIRKGN